MKKKLPPVVLFPMIWGVLVILLLDMFGLAHANLGASGTAIILLAAFVQMILVLSFFMGLRHSAKIIRLFSAAGFCWLLFLFILAFSDYLTRQWH